MKIVYNEQDDILCIEFSDDPIIRDMSLGWNFNIGYSQNGIVEITVLDAKENGHWPPEFESVDTAAIK